MPDPSSRPRSRPQNGAQAPQRAELPAEVLDQARLGRPEACRQLVDHFQGLVFAQLRGMLLPAGREAAVEDLAQETFLRAFRALDRFEGPTSGLRPWLATIATRVALNELRRRRPKMEVVDPSHETIPAQSGDPRRVVGRGVMAAIAELPDAFRAAFLLRELHGMDYAEISEVLQCDLGTVKSRLSRARARLRQALRANGGQS